MELDFYKEISQIREEYRAAHQSILNDSRINISQVLKKRYLVGSLISDHIGSGRIISTHVVFSGDSINFSINFKCENLTKKGTINKREPTRIIYGCNLK